MRVFSSVRLAVAFCLYLFMLGAVMWPLGMLLRLWMALIRADDRTRRLAYTEFNAVWAARVARMAAAALGISFDIRVPLHRSVPYIYVMNHRSALDSVILFLVATRMGDPHVRWVIKEGILRVPFLGALARDTGYAVVVRQKDRPEMDEDTRRDHNAHVMDRFVELAQEDGVSVGLFPEGERFDGAADGAVRRHVGAPKAAGFRKLCRRLSRHGVASVTVAWPTPPGGKTVFDTGALCGRTIRIDVELHGHVRPEDAEAFLEADWNKKERLIAGLSKEA